MKRTLLLLFLGLGWFCGVRTHAEEAEAQAPQPSQNPGPASGETSKDDPYDSKKVQVLIGKLTSDSWAEREAAMLDLAKAGPKAVPDLYSASEKATDPEIKTRLTKALAAIREAPICGKFKQVSIDTIDAAGKTVDQVSKNPVGSLSIGNGEVIWSQAYNGTTTVQTYSFDASRLAAPSPTEYEVLLTFQNMETDHGYSPESESPKLVFYKTPEGLKVTFTATDGQEHTSTVKFVFTAKE